MHTQSRQNRLVQKRGCRTEGEKEIWRGGGLVSYMRGKKE